jgi:hypothetical protein
MVPTSFSLVFCSKNSDENIKIIIDMFLTLQRYYTENSKQIFLGKELRGFNSNSYIHVSVCNLLFPRSVCLFCCKENRWTDRGNI